MARGMWIGANRAVTLKNLLDGGKFKDTTYWTAHNTTYTVSGYVATSTGSGTWPELHKELSVTSGHIYYARVRTKYTHSGTHTKSRISFRPTGQNSSVSIGTATKADGSWESISIRTALNCSAVQVLLWLPYTGSGTAISGLSVQWNQPLMIDLTACFGAGKEPTKEWCDSNISFFDSTTTANNPNVSNVARRVKNWWIGIDGSGYRLLFNVPAGDKVNIGGDLFTVVNHGYKKYGFSGNTVLWGEKAIGQGTWRQVMSWNESNYGDEPTGVDSAFNTTITNLALSNPYCGGNDKYTASTTHKFRIIPEYGILSGVSGKRYVNGVAVNHWIQNCGVTTESDLDETYTLYGPYWFYYINTSGSQVTLRLGGSLSDSSMSVVYPDSSHNYYYFYMCEVDGNTKVTYNANTGYWELFKE